MTTPESLREVVAPAVLEAARAVGIGIAIVQIDARGGDLTPRLLFVNEALADLLGRTIPEILACAPFELLAPEDRARVHEAFVARIRGEGRSPRHECNLVAAGDSRVPVELGVHVVRTETQLYEVLLVRDLRDRRAAEARVAASERLFRELVEAAPDGIVINRRGAVLYANGAAARILGVPAEALVGRSLGEFLAPEDAERMRARSSELVAGRTLAPSEYRARRPDGRIVVAEIASIPIEFDGGPAVLAFARDVTERATVQAELARTDRLAALGRLAAGMAHEINNPLGFASLSAEALDHKIQCSLPDGDERRALLELVEHVRRGTERVAAIVRDLKAFSRDSTGAPSKVDLTAVLDAAARMVAHELAPRARLERDVGELPAVVGDAGRLEQVFVNLLMNAAQSLTEGARGLIRIEARQDGERVVVEVSDTGSGIEADVLERVFDPFFTTKPTGVGTGLGLSICHGIVRSFGGDIAIRSTVGAGTTVRVELRVAAGPAAATEPQGAPPPATRRGRVLVVEDTPAFAKMIGQILSASHAVTIVGSVADANDAMRAPGAVFDVVLCDITLGDGTGVDVYETALRERPELARRFVFMTGGAFTPRAIDFLESTTQPRLEKPFPVSALEHAIQAALR